jgi:hypothetical protein
MFLPRLPAETLVHDSGDRATFVAVAAGLMLAKAMF